MTISKLEQLYQNRRKKVEIHLTNGKKLRCIPIQYLEEDYESFLVDTYESFGGYPEKTLVELKEKEIKAIKQIK